MTVIECNSGKIIYALIGDVTGHGIPQGLVTMAAFGAVQTLRPLIQQNHKSFSPSIIMNILRSTLITVLAECDLAMTVAVIKIDLESREIRLCNAGHPFPLVIGREAENLMLRPITSKPQSPFGYELLTRSILNANYTDTVRKLGANEILILFSDGLTDARNKELKSFQRSFIQLLREQQSLSSPVHLLEEIVSRLNAHLNGKQAEDDICVMLIDTRQDGIRENIA